MPKQSAGILLYKKENGQPLFFLVHPGGPFFKNKDLGSWTIPKGEYLDDACLSADREDVRWKMEDVFWRFRRNCVYCGVLAVRVKRMERSAKREEAVNAK